MKKTLHSILIFAPFFIYFEQLDSIFSGSLKGLDKYKLSGHPNFVQEQ